MRKVSMRKLLVTASHLSTVMLLDLMREDISPVQRDLLHQENLLFCHMNNYGGRGKSKLTGHLRAETIKQPKYRYCYTLP